MVSPGWVVVLAFAASGAQTPSALAGARPPSRRRSRVHRAAPMHAPPTQLPAAPLAVLPLAAVHCESNPHAPFWNTPVGPAGDAQVLVTYANPPSSDDRRHLVGEAAGHVPLGVGEPRALHGRQADGGRPCRSRRGPRRGGPSSWCPRRDRAGAGPAAAPPAAVRTANHSVDVHGLVASVARCRRCW